MQRSSGFNTVTMTYSACSTVTNVVKMSPGKPDYVVFEVRFYFSFDLVSINPFQASRNKSKARFNEMK